MSGLAVLRGFCSGQRAVLGDVRRQIVHGLFHRVPGGRLRKAPDEHLLLSRPQLPYRGRVGLVIMVDHAAREIYERPNSASRFRTHAIDFPEILVISDTFPADASASLFT
jgi:hypothetical protein